MGDDPNYPSPAEIGETMAKMAEKQYLNPATGNPISRQRAWQIKKAAAGLCIICGLPAEDPGLTYPYCLKHRDAQRVRAREYARKRFGFQGRYLNCASYKKTPARPAGAYTKTTTELGYT